ncbi:SIR2 family protein [Pseudomonas sp. R2.Fl]|nr:SIR2 family protein [Pseudomonas sp. R2.Fl]
MYFEALEEDIKLRIAEGISNSKYYLLCGSGTSLDSVGQRGPMKSGMQLADAINKHKGLAKTTSLQRGARALSQSDKQIFLTEGYRCVSPGITSKRILSYAWKRIFTFNIDDVFESILSEVIKEPNFDLGNPIIYNFDDTYGEPDFAAVQDVVHLHGFVRKPDAGYVFSLNDYMKTLGRNNAWVAVLTQLMAAEPFVITGTSLEEPDVEYYLTKRVPSVADTQDYRSIIVEPFPDPIMEQISEEHGYVIFRGTVEQFLQRMHELAGPPNPKKNHAANVREISLPSFEKGDAARFNATFEVPPVNPDKDIPRSWLLLGDEPKWDHFAAAHDVRRDVESSIIGKIEHAMKDPGVSAVILLGEPGCGKSILLRRIAYNIRRSTKNVLYFKGVEACTASLAAQAIRSLGSQTLIFCDNVADSANYFSDIVSEADGSGATIIAMERSYRRPYLESAFGRQSTLFIDLPQDISQKEAKRLIRAFEEEGVAEHGVFDQDQLNKRSRDLSNDVFAIASCRIQNNFASFDKIVGALRSEVDESYERAYLTIALGRLCFANGVSRTIVGSATGIYISASNNPISAPLPVVKSPIQNGYLVPSRAVVGDRLVLITSRENKKKLLSIFEDLANALAPHVNPRNVKARTPESKLAAGLLDYDRLVKVYIDLHAESFYENIENLWGWNSRFWDQKALLKLDRYLAAPENNVLLDESIQHARFATSIENHPLSNTTLARVLFTAMKSKQREKDVLFSEAFDLLIKSIRVESGWGRMKATSFAVLFNGVLEYVQLGGGLRGDDADRLRDILKLYNMKGFADVRVAELASSVASLVSAGKTRT